MIIPGNMINHEINCCFRLVDMRLRVSPPTEPHTPFRSIWHLLPTIVAKSKILRHCGLDPQSPTTMRFSGDFGTYCQQSLQNGKSFVIAGLTGLTRNPQQLCAAQGIPGRARNDGY
jgi:hypothetical protein